jgi:hypothetical protein
MQYVLDCNFSSVSKVGPPITWKSFFFALLILK